jgi:hypothetical protein
MATGASLAAGSGDIWSPSTRPPCVAFIARPELKGRFSYTPDATRLDFQSETRPARRLPRRVMAPLGDANAPPFTSVRRMDLYLPGLRTANDLVLNHPMFAASPPMVGAWIGNRTTALAHHDMSQLACVTVGRRRFTLFPPEQVENLYPGPLEPTPGGQVVTMADIQAPDYERFPKLREALAAAQVAEMEPGDALFYPAVMVAPGRSARGFNVMINYWWNTTPAYMDSPRTLLHALLSLRDRPEQRSAWRAMFDYYVFGPGRSGGAPARRVRARKPCSTGRGHGASAAGQTSPAPQSLTEKRIANDQTRRHRRRRHGRLDRGGGPRSNSARCSTSRWWSPTRSAPSAWREATIPTIRSFHVLLGLDERGSCARPRRASSSASDSTIGRDPVIAIHAFGNIGKSTWMGGFHNMWLQAKAAGFGDEIGDYCLEYQASRAGKFAISDRKPINCVSLRRQSLCAIPASKFEPKGVKRIEGKISVEQDKPERLRHRAWV